MFIPFDSAMPLLGLCPRNTVVVHMKTMHKSISHVYVGAANRYTYRGSSHAPGTALSCIFVSNLHNSPVRCSKSLSTSKSPGNPDSAEVTCPRLHRKDMVEPTISI